MAVDSTGTRVVVSTAFEGGVAAGNKSVTLSGGGAGLALIGFKLN
jgi:hypothetical protein